MWVDTICGAPFPVFFETLERFIEAWRV